MSGGLERDEAFWKLVGALEQAGVLRHVMIIGTWAEWLYTDYFEQPASLQGDASQPAHDLDSSRCNLWHVASTPRVLEAATSRNGGEEGMTNSFGRLLR